MATGRTLDRYCLARYVSDLPLAIDHVLVVCCTRRLGRVGFQGVSFSKIQNASKHKVSDNDAIWVFMAVAAPCISFKAIVRLPGLAEPADRLWKTHGLGESVLFHELSLTGFVCYVLIVMISEGSCGAKTRFL